METLVGIVKSAVRVPFALVGEARKIVASVLGQGEHGDAELSPADVEQAKQDIQAGIREQTKASIETAKVAEEIRDHTVTAENAPL